MTFAVEWREPSNHVTHMLVLNGALGPPLESVLNLVGLEEFSLLHLAIIVARSRCSVKVSFYFKLKPTQFLKLC